LCLNPFDVGIQWQQEQLTKVHGVWQWNDALILWLFIFSLLCFVQVSGNSSISKKYFFLIFSVEDFFIYYIGSTEVREKLNSFVCWFKNTNTQVVPMTVTLQHLPNIT
jgi:hypothetical protein